MKSLGIIAGNRNFPILVARSARDQGIHHLVAVGFRGITEPQLERHVDEMAWIGLGQLGCLKETFRSEGVQQLVMVGQIPQGWVLRSLKFDSEGLKFFREIREKNASSVLGALIERLEGEGFCFLDSTQFLKDQLVKEGVLTQAQPSAEQWEDLKYGWKIAKALADLDVGQTVVVKDGVLVALEGMEGTDALVLRGGKLAGKGAVVMKVARTHQDMRYDVPVIGLATLKVLRKARASCLGVEAGKTLILEGEEFLKRAQGMGVVVVGMGAGHAEA